MTIVFILGVVAIVIVVGLRHAIRGFAAQVTDPEQLLGRTRALDLLAFRNLIDPGEDEYLRTRLPWHALWRVRRARHRAAAEYVRMAAVNAAILVRLAQTAQHSDQLRIREAASQLLALATETRVLAGFALLQLYFAWLFPWWQPSLGNITLAYTGLRATLDRVVGWQRPELAGRIRAVV